MFAIINERFVAADSGWILGGYYWIYVSIESIESTEASMGETQLSGIIVYNLISSLRTLIVNQLFFFHLLVAC